MALAVIISRCLAAKKFIFTHIYPDRFKVHSRLHEALPAGERNERAAPGRIVPRGYRFANTRNKVDRLRAFAFVCACFTLTTTAYRSSNRIHHTMQCSLSMTISYTMTICTVSPRHRSSVFLFLESSRIFSNFLQFFSHTT